MAGSFTLPTVLANLTAGNQPLSLIDGDLTTLASPLLALGTFGNYYVDSGSANAYAITVSAPQTVAVAAGLPVQFIAGARNTGASTLQINALAAKNILNPDGSALLAGQIYAGAIVSVQYDGTQFQILGPAPTQRVLAKSAAAASAPADTNEDTLATITVPANALGANGGLRISTLWTITSSGNLKTMRIRYSGASGTLYSSIGLTTEANLSTGGMIQNRNATNSQVGSTYADVTSGTLVGLGKSTSAVDTTAGTTIVITGQKASAGETITLESYLVELMPG